MTSILRGLRIAVSAALMAESVGVLSERDARDLTAAKAWLDGLTETTVLIELTRKQAKMAALAVVAYELRQGVDDDGTHTDDVAKRFYRALREQGR